LHSAIQIDSLPWGDSPGGAAPAVVEASMLDGSRYFAEFPDEDPSGGRVPLSPELLTTLAAIEREISGFIRTAPGSNQPNLSAIVRIKFTDE